ncbi:MAG: InlB B-repeat-containing protein [Fibrobacter sp.]|nr:InlB B-repeat-containing protein [Fibrobacter sp.]
MFKRVIVRIFAFLAVFCSLSWGATLTVTTGTNGGSVSPTSKSVSAGTSVTITATPESGRRFVNWSVTPSANCVLADNKSATTKVTVNGDCTVKATFKLIYTVTVTASAGGRTDVTSKVVDYNGAWKFTAIPNTGYMLSNWTITSGADKCKLENATELTARVSGVSGDCTIKANFVHQPFVDVKVGPYGSDLYTGCVATNEKVCSLPTLPGGSCLLIGSSCILEYTASLEPGSSINIKYELREGYAFEKWELAGSSYFESRIEEKINEDIDFDPAHCKIADPSSPSTTLTVNGDCIVQTKVRALPYYNVRVASGQGNVSPAKQSYAEVGSKVNISATADYGYRFTKWSVSGSNCVIADSKSSSTTMIVNGNCMVYANFVETVVVGVSAGTGGTVSPKDYVTYDVGSSNAITATPSTGYRFDKWTVSDTKNCVVANTASASTKVTVKGPCQITAMFIRNYRVDVALDAVGYYYETARNEFFVDAGTKAALVTPTYSGFRFYRWRFEKGAENCSISDTTAATTEILVNGNCHVDAVMLKVETLTVSAGAGGGTVAPHGDNSVLASLSAKIAATASSGYRFDKWVSSHDTKCPIADPSSNATSVTVNASCTVTAKFVKQARVTRSCAVGGCVRGGSATYDSGSTVDVDGYVNSGFRFDHWVVSPKENCKIADSTVMKTTMVVNGDCSIQPFIVKQHEVTFSSNLEGVFAEEKKALDEGVSVPVTAVEKDGFVFAYWVIKSGRENCSISEDYGMTTSITANGECTLYAHYAPDPAYKVTEEFVKYDYVKNHQGFYDGSIRFMLEPSDEKWYRVDFYTRLPRFREFTVNYFDKGSFDSIPIYWIGVTHWDTITTFIPASASGSYFTISHNESNSYYCDHEVSVRAELVPSYPLEIVAGDGGYIGEYELYRMYKTLPVGAYIPYMAVPYLGYMPDSWDVLEGGCSVQYAWNYDYYALMNDGKCSIRMNFTDDTTIVPTLKINSLDESDLPRLCADVSVGVDGQDGTIWYIDSSRFVVSIGGDTVAASYDTVWREGQQSYVLCFDPTDKIFNGDDYEIKVGVNFAGKFAADSIEWVEPKWREKDTEDSVSIVVASGSGDVVRATDKFKVVVNTQNFADDVVDPIPSLNVVVACAVSGDEESVTAAHVDGGKYESAAIAKREGAAVRGDGVLDCAAKDSVVARFVDPVYGGETRTAVGFEDVVKNEYKFVQVGGAAGNASDVESSAALDSVETMNAEFGFRVTAVSPTLYKADTIMVALFTDAGDTVWVSAVETDVYSSEFVGEGSFKFVVNAADQKDTLLDAAMDLDAESNRVVIYAQVDGDKSELESRDSLVVYYDFIPADSAEILDQDQDGRADFVRVHFVRDVRREDFAIDTVVWGSGKGRGVDASEIVVSADGRWIEAPLKAAFDYGVTEDAVDKKGAGKGYLAVSRKTASAAQKISLKDRVGAVAVSAVKHPGKLSDEDYMDVDAVLPPDTLVVTMSEAEDSIAAKTFELVAGSAAGSAAKSGFVKFGKASADKSRKVWTLVLARSVDIHVGDTLTTNPDASTFDKAGNAPGIGGVTVTGEEGEVYLYIVKAHPPVVKAGNRARIKVETKKSYKAYVTIFDNMGNFIAQFSGRSKFEDANADNATQVSFIEWDQYTDDGRLAGTGVYIWKIHFVFSDGHKEWRTIRTGIKR